MITNCYCTIAEPHLEKALSCLDIEESSPSVGSFDRTWWCWKFTDFPSPRAQEGLFTLAWLYTSPLAPKAYHENMALLTRINAAILFWSKLQHKDGSYDEAYPYERSLAATAFTTFYGALTIERLKSHLPSSIQMLALKTIRKAAEWLTKNGEYHSILSNHLAAAAASLQVASELLQQPDLLQSRDRYLNLILQHQNQEEGWLCEYGGADPGYQTHALFYLSDIWRRTRDPRLAQCLRLACEFSAWFMHPDGTTGGEYASRGTTFIFPAAFEILREAIPIANTLANTLRSQIEQNKGVGLPQMDIWNFFPMLNNYLIAAENARTTMSTTQPLPWQTLNGNKVFHRAGLCISKQNDRLLAINLNLGGCCKLWDTTTQRLLYEDCGYAIKKGKTYCISQAPSRWEYLQDQNQWKITAPFNKVKSQRFSPWRFLGFRLFNLSFGRMPEIAIVIKRYLVYLLIKKQQSSQGTIVRTLSFSMDGRLKIIDEIKNTPECPFPIARQVPYHMGSTRYANRENWLGAEYPCPVVDEYQDRTARRYVKI